MPSARSVRALRRHQRAAGHSGDGRQQKPPAATPHRDGATARSGPFADVGEPPDLQGDSQPPGWTASSSSAAPAPASSRILTVVTVQFSDGSSVEADVLVGADGTGSPVRRRYLPHAAVEDTGVVCVYGRTPLTAETRPLLPAPVRDGFTAVLGGSIGMAAGLLDFREPPPQAARRIAPDVLLRPARPYLMWAVTGAARQFGQAVTANWSPVLPGKPPRGSLARGPPLASGPGQARRARRGPGDVPDRRQDRRPCRRLAGQPGHAARRRHSRDEPRARLRCQHGAARRRAARRRARCRRPRREDPGPGGRRLRTADDRLRLLGRARLPGRADRAPRAKPTAPASASRFLRRSWFAATRPRQRLVGRASRPRAVRPGTAG